jgi:hypothetical protein
VRDVSPLVRRKPNRLFALAGLRSELTMSVPVPITAKLAAMAALCLLNFLLAFESGRKG